MNDRSTLQTLTLLFGIVFLAVGILGFIPGNTTHYGDLSFAGDGSESKLLGIFQVSVLHNIIHLLFGVVGLWAARAFDSSRIYMTGGGIIYLALFVLGLFDGLNWVPANNADDWLHLGLGVAMVGIGYVLGKEQVSRTAAA
jgi:hypothetical protein